MIDAIPFQEVWTCLDKPILSVKSVEWEFLQFAVRGTYIDSRHTKITESSQPTKSYEKHVKNIRFFGITPWVKNTLLVQVR